MTLASTPPGDWLAGIAQLLDEHHLVVVADDRDAAATIGRTTAARQAGLPQTRVITVNGAETLDAASFTAAAIDGTGGVSALAAALRHRPDDARWQYIVWLDADEMLEHDVALFGRVANTLFSVAAEHEHVTTDAMLIQRVIMTGGPKLGAYTEEEGGQFRTWLPGTKVAECLERPPVITYRVNG